MIESICIVIWVITGFLMLTYLGKPNRYRWFTPLGVFWVFYLARMQLPSLYVYRESGWSQHAGMWAYPVMVAIAPLFVFLGAILGGRRSAEAWVQWWDRPLLIRNNVRVSIWILIGLGSLILLAHVIAVRGNVPVIAIITHIGDYAYMAQLRERALKFMPLYLTYFLLWNRDLILPMAAMGALVVAMFLRRGWALFILALFLASFQAMFTIARGPMAFLVLKCAAMYYLATRKKIRIIRIVIIVFLVMSFPLGVNMLKYGTAWSLAEVGKTYSALFGRIFYTTTWTTGAHVAHVPKRSGGFLYGRSIGWYARITRQPPYNLANQVYRQFLADLPSGIANTCYVGDAWGNFGWPGVVFYSLFVGWWLSLMESLLLRLPYVPMAVAMHVTASMQAMNLVEVALPPFLLTFGGIVLVLCMVFWRSSEATYLEEAALIQAEQGYSD